MNNYFCFQVTLLVGVLLSGSYAFNCYQCSHHSGLPQNGSDCNEATVSETFNLPCEIAGYNGSDYQCIKLTGTLTDDQDNEYTVVGRNCAAGNNVFPSGCRESNAIVTQFGTLTKGSICRCNDEGCNSSPKTVGGGIAMILLIISSMFLF